MFLAVNPMQITLVLQDQLWAQKLTKKAHKLAYSSEYGAFVFKIWFKKNESIFFEELEMEAGVL